MFFLTIAEIFYLDERLHFRPRSYLLLGHLLCHLPRVPVDTSHQGVTEGLVVVPLIRGFDNDGLPASISSTEQQDNLACLHYLPHVGI